jgi:hypothetical protein
MNQIVRLLVWLTAIALWGLARTACAAADRPSDIVFTHADSTFSHLRSSLLAMMADSTCFPWNATALERQFGDVGLLRACVSHDHESETYTYRSTESELLVIGRQFHLTPARLMPFADSTEIVFDESFGSGRQCPPDPVWGAPYLKRYQQWEVSGYTIQMRINTLHEQEGQSRFPFVAIEVVRGHVECNRWIGQPVRG